MPIDPVTGQRLPYPGEPGFAPGGGGLPAGPGAPLGGPDPASFGALDPLGQLQGGGGGQRPGLVLAALLQHVEQRQQMAEQIIAENQDVSLVAEQIMQALAGPPPETLNAPAGTESQAMVPEQQLGPGQLAGAF